MSAIASLTRSPPPGFPAGILHHGLGAVEVLRHLVPPVAEGSFGVLHDVALVHERQALAAVADRVADRAVHEALGAETADRLQAHADLHGHLALRRANRLELLLPLGDGGLAAEADLFEFFRKLLREEIENLLRFGRARDVFDAGVDVLRVFPEDHHVDLFGMPHGRRHAAKPADRPQADEQVEHLPQRDVQRSDPAADRRRQRTFDADVMSAECLDRFVRQPGVELLEALLAGKHLFPCDAPLAAVRFLYGRIEHAHARAPDVGAGAIAFDERNDRIVGHDELPTAARDRCAHGFRSRHLSREEDFRDRCGKLCGKRSRLRTGYTDFRMF